MERVLLLRMAAKLVANVLSEDILRADVSPVVTVSVNVHEDACVFRHMIIAFSEKPLRSLILVWTLCGFEELEERPVRGLTVDGYRWMNICAGDCGILGYAGLMSFSLLGLDTRE
jgi:hypothetical protein